MDEIDPVEYIIDLVLEYAECRERSVGADLMTRTGAGVYWEEEADKALDHIRDTLNREF